MDTLNVFNCYHFKIFFLDIILDENNNIVVKLCYHIFSSLYHTATNSLYDYMNAIVNY